MDVLVKYFLFFGKEVVEFREAMRDSSQSIHLFLLFVKVLNGILASSVAYQGKVMTVSILVTYDA